MSDSEPKKLTVMIPQETYLKALSRMGPLGLKFQGLLLGLLQNWVDEGSATLVKQPAGQGVRQFSKSDSLLVDQLFTFLETAGSDDVKALKQMLAGNQQLLAGRELANRLLKERKG